jgi:peroxiredoxin
MSRSLPVLLFLLLQLLQVGCFRNEPSGGSTDDEGQGIEITGSIRGGEGLEVTIDELGARELIPIDTVRCDGTGKFEIHFQAKGPAFYVMRYGDDGRVTLLIEPGEKVVFSAFPEEGGSYQVQGSRGSELLRQLSEEHQRTLKELGKIARQNMSLINDPEYTSRKMNLDRQFDSITAAFHDYSLTFIRENAGSLAILVALYNMYGEGLPVFQPGNDMEVYHFVDSALYQRYEGTEAVDLLHAQLSKVALEGKAEEHFQSLRQGELAPDFVSSRPDGTRLALTDYRGDYVLLSFWAGWSALSREENVTLKEAFLAYRDQPFRILQVSLDDRREVWMEAIRTDGLEWDQVCDLQRWDSPVVNMYHVEKIPSNVLIDPDGRIMGTDLLGDVLLEKLESIFNH